ncbi:hypothetical protein QBC38DRAFT_373843, partial [Podospora fimiseda]
PNDDPISRLLYTKVSAIDPAADNMRFRVLVPSVEGDTISPVVYVAYAWACVKKVRELNLEEDLPAEIPKGFEELRKEILGFVDRLEEVEEGEYPVQAMVRIPDEEEGKLGVYLVVTYEIRGHVPDDWTA